MRLPKLRCPIDISWKFLSWQYDRRIKFQRSTTIVLYFYQYSVSHGIYFALTLHPVVRDCVCDTRQFSWPCTSMQWEQQSHWCISAAAAASTAAAACWHSVKYLLMDLWPNPACQHVHLPFGFFGLWLRSSGTLASVLRTPTLYTLAATSPQPQTSLVNLTASDAHLICCFAKFLPIPPMSSWVLVLKIVPDLELSAIR